MKATGYVSPHLNPHLNLVLIQEAFKKSFSLSPCSLPYSILHTTVTAGVKKSSGGIQEVFLPPSPFHTVFMKVTSSVEKSSHEGLSVLDFPIYILHI